jgi:hypothetical protein
MDIKQDILEELNQAPEDFYFQEVLHFIQFLKLQYQEELESDLEAVKTVKEEMAQEGTISFEQVKQELGL